METKQKTFWQYYSLILREAIGKAWNLIGAGGTVLGIVVSIGASIIYTKPTTLQEIGLNEAIIAAIIFIGLGIVLSAFYVLVQPVIYNNQQIQKVIDLNEELNSVKPKIQLLDQPTINLVLMKQNDWEDYALIAVVPFVNNPDHPTSKNNAANIRAEIQYLNEKREILLPHWIQGRWTNSPEPSQLERGTHQQLESTDFPNNRLCVGSI